MRLIDADALILSLQIDQELCFGCPEPEWMEEIIQTLENAPTVEIGSDFISRDKVECFVRNIVRQTLPECIVADTVETIMNKYF